MKLQTKISDAHEKKLTSYKASLELDGRERTMTEVMEHMIDHAKVENEQGE
ncbi:MAG: hypothetical protein PHH85_09115 [Candidatus Methanoperedens sp.]|nr:hypothetical protein [Candidatus Methanoperedens sp.]